MQVEEWLGADNQIGIDIWNKKYRFKDESFDEWLDRVSGGDEKVRELIVDKKFLFGGRILANRGLDKKGLKVTYSNCYVLAPPEDSIESIFDVGSKMARTFSYGGGVGIDLSNLAPRGAKVNNTAMQTSGAVSFTDFYSMITGLIGQNGRRGALMLSMSCEHPDIEEFMRCKTDVNRVTKANMSIRITDEFMEAVEDKDTFNLSFHRPETNEYIIKTIYAPKFFNDMCEANYDYGEPGCLFWDRINDWSLVGYNAEFRYAGTNPCVSGDTLILTDNGYVEIKDVVGKEVSVWNGYTWSNVVPKITGYDQPMLKVTFSDGCELNCTDYHKFVLENGVRVKANKLKVGNKLVKHRFPIIWGGRVFNRELAYTNGFFSGDGYVNNRGCGKVRYGITLYDKKSNLYEHMIYKSKCVASDGSTTRVYLHECDGMGVDQKLSKTYVPGIEYDVLARLDWLAGLIDSDGCLNSKDGSISISSVDKEFLMNVKLLLNTVGSNGKVSLMHEECSKYMPKNNGTDELGLYHCKDCYRIIINAYNVARLVDLGLKTYRVPLIANPNRDASRFVTVTKIERIENVEKVYCLNEPKNHTFIANGVITGNCGEEPLPAGGSCLLGSINLSAFVKDRKFDFCDFMRTVECAVNALNDVLDEGVDLHPLKEQRESVEKWRQIGLGIMGLSDMFIKMGIRYDSEEALKLVAGIGARMINVAMLTSSLLAKEKGSYPGSDGSELVSNFISLDWITDMTYTNVDNYGLRNSQLLTIAPTGTISTMIGVSGGIEPIFAKSYTRTTKSLDGVDKTYTIYTPIVKEYMEEHNLTDESELPDYFVTALDIDYKDRIKMQATWQKYIDAAISSTINIPEDFPKENVKDIYLEAWKQGCKGVTIFRSGCKREPILTTKDASKRGVVETVNDDVVGKKRKLMTGCGTLHCSAFYDPNTGALKEVFLNKGSQGGCQACLNATSRLISLSLRSGCETKEVVEQLNSVPACPAYSARRATKGDTSKGSSCAGAVANALIEMCDEIKIKPTETKKHGCPECGDELIHEGGCNSCKSCGWSKCG